MAATRSPSPMGSIHSPSQDLLLSPRSRLEARLAAIDTSSDEDDSLPTLTSYKKPSKQPTETQSTTVDSDDESDIDIRPRGRLAAQMQTGHARREDHVRNDDKDDDEEDDQDIVSAAPRRLKRKTTPPVATPARRSPSVGSSPGLFVTSHPSPSQQKQEPDHRSGSDSDELPNLTRNHRFQALLERKRQERLAKEAEEQRKREEAMAHLEGLGELGDPGDEEDNASSITDDEGGRRLTQKARPPRRAGKKALEEMHRETQRMARNMQLAHEAKTRKKITKESLFERFKFKTAEPPGPKDASSSRPTTPDSPHHTDAEIKDHETPPSSPPHVGALSTPKGTTVPAPTETGDDVDEFPTSEPPVDAAAGKVDKGKGLAVDGPEETVTAKNATTKPRRRVRVKLPVNLAEMVSARSDDELEITTTRKNRIDAIFNRVPEKRAQQGNSLHALRILAQVKSPGKEARKTDNKSSMTPGEMQFMLYQRARQQAKEERERRIEMLKAKGIVVQTEEEREKEMQEVDDMVARARLEAEEIMKREQEAAKEERRRKIKNGELDPLAWDDSEDEEYEGSDEEDQGQDDEDAADGDREIELSGSEDEQDEAEAGDGSDAESPADDNTLVEEKADDENTPKEDRPPLSAEETQQPDSDEEGIVLPSRNIRRPKKHVHVVSDDEDDNDAQDVIVEATPKPKTNAHMSPAPPRSDSPAMPTSVLRSAKKTFIPGLPVVGPAGLSLTQIFVGTMDDDDDSQYQLQQPGTASLTMPMPSPTRGLPDLDVSQDAGTQPGDEMVLDSQGGGRTQKAETQADGETQGVQLRFTQSQMHGFDSLLRQENDMIPTQMTIEPSQDVGLQEYTPLRERFIEAPASTAQTVITSKGLPEADEEDEEKVQDSPLVRRGRLRRKIESSEAEPPQSTAFGIMKTAAREQRQKEVLDKKKSKAREMFEEQAEESEDEYAGLGGADGEDSSGDDEDAASVKEMIDDDAETAKEDDERKIAALYADRERARDEQMVDKLFRDITTGMLRRKRGADYDLSDSDDGGEARRRLKRRQFAKMQKALFADERIKKMAEKPGNQAFLRTIEDRDTDVMDFLDIGPEPMDVDVENSHNSSSSSSQDQVVPDSQPQDEGRVPLGATGNGASANPRRTKDGKRKPSNIGEIRESLSSLLEEPEGSIVPATEVGSDSEAEDDDETSRRAADAAASGGDKENTSPKGRNRRRGRAAVIDRMSLKRESSSNASTHSRTAFARPTAGVSGSSGFKVPGLLRRATANSISVTSGSSSTGAGGGGSVTATTGAASRSTNGGSGGGFGDDGIVRKGVGKRSAISALARETERQTAMAQAERRREAKKWKGAEMRGKAFGGLIGTGKFE